MNDGAPAARRVKTADTIFEVIETLRDLDGATVTEVANTLDIAPSTAHTHLRTLESKSYVVERDGEYSLSLRFLDHGTLVRDRIGIVDYARPNMKSLAENTGESVWLVYEQNGLAYFLDREIGDQGIAIDGRVGSSVPVHWLAAGKAILSEYSNDRIRNVLDQDPLERSAPNTITDIDGLIDEIDGIRDRGHAFADSELFDGVRAIGVPIVPEDEVVGAISVAGPANRLRGDYFREELPAILLGDVNEIEIRYVSE